MRNVARTEELRNAYNILVVKSECKGMRKRFLRGWKDSIDIHFIDIDWIKLAWARVQFPAVVNTVINLRLLDYTSNYWFLKKDCAPFSLLESLITVWTLINSSEVECGRGR